ncbi:FAD-dependent monooxygenase [Bacillus paramycoides]|uniref:FAD-dependent monooxygenase n=1 Tax=Bacillus paramycoides TaxID=2026194 RepID=UPI002E215622|nr:FAD-dependent monooxygenase [Bacillus paramycoides]MED1558651.1 FAD-dependent monooxygenase [Bacillus paramycoides]
MEKQVLIVGAGPTGLALALGLKKQGIPFRIIDKNAGPGTASRAMVVAARTLEFYHQYDVAEDLIRSGIKVESADFYKNKKLWASLKVKDFGKEISPYPYILSIPQDEHETILVEQLRARGVEVEWNTELISFIENKDQIQVKIDKTGIKEEETYDYLCGCDGAHSMVRKTLGFDFAGGTYEQMFYVADVKSSTPNLSFFANLLEDGFCLSIPIRTTGHVRLIGLIPKYILSQGIPSDFTPLIPYVEKNVNLKVDTVNWYSPYKVHHRVSEHFRKGRVFIAGDAGHIHSPVGGQGMNTGIGDAINLAWKLSAVLHKKADEKILDSYESERIGFAKSLVSTTDRAFTVVVSDGMGANAIKSVVPYLLPIMTKLPTIRKKMFKIISQTQIHYQTSMLSEGSAGQVHGGDRLPWIQTDYGDNFDYLRSGDWQFHVYGEATQDLRKLAKYSAIPIHEIKWTTSMKDIGVPRNCVLLVRPDGYVALANVHQDTNKIKVYLDKFKISSIRH